MENIANHFRSVLGAAFARDRTSDYSLRISAQIRSGADPADILRVEPPLAESYSDSESFWEDRMRYDLLRKLDADFGVDTEGAAVASFFEAERRCFATNSRFSLHAAPLGVKHQSFIDNFVREVKNEIRDLLGKLPPLLDPVFTGGATLSDKYGKTTLPDKLSSAMTMYPDFSLLLPLVRKTGWWVSSGPNLTLSRSNSFFTVPKTWKTRRGCCKEASLPLAYQRAVGVTLRQRLRKWGIDLLHGVPQHHAAAALGSLKGSYATIDLSQASDSLARNVVKTLLPPDWYDLLDSMRAKSTKVDGKVYLLEKFSSMGNGFTFELETLVFAAVGRYVLKLLGHSPSELLVYGDDIICPTDCTSVLISALRYIGFEVNPAKTFVSGPFRESCGGDYFNGVAVPTVKLQKLPESPSEWMSLHNNALRCANGVPSRIAFVTPLLELCLRSVPSHIRRCQGPRLFGDLVFHNENPLEWSVRWLCPRGEGQFADTRHLSHAHVRVYQPVPKRISLKRGLAWGRWNEQACLLSVILGSPSAAVTPRGEVSGYRLTWAALGWSDEQRLVGLSILSSLEAA